MYSRGGPGARLAVDLLKRDLPQIQHARRKCVDEESSTDRESARENAELIIQFSVSASDLLRVTMPASDVHEWVEDGLRAMRIVKDEEVSLTYSGVLRDPRDTTRARVSKDAWCAKRCSLHLAASLAHYDRKAYWASALSSIRALAIARRRGKKHLVSRAAGNLGIALAELGQSTFALWCFRFASRTAAEVDDALSRPNQLGNIGIAMVEAGHYELGEYCLRLALRRHAELERPIETAISQAELGIALLLQGRSTEAAALVRDALEVAEEFEMDEQAQQWNRLLKLCRRSRNRANASTS